MKKVIVTLGTKKVVVATNLSDREAGYKRHNIQRDNPGVRVVTSRM